MNLVIDIGNTCVKLLSFCGNEVIEEKRSDKDDILALESFCAKYSFEKGVFSTVSELTKEYRSALLDLPFPMLEFKSGQTHVPIINKYKNDMSVKIKNRSIFLGRREYLIYETLSNKIPNFLIYSKELAP